MFAAPVTLHIACASNFVSTLKKIISLYEKNHDVNVVLIQGSSGALSPQIINGLPIDVFFSADKKYTQYLIEHQQAERSFLYAIGEVVLVAKGTTKYKSAKDFLLHAQYLRLSLAKPQLSPYGVHSVAILRHMGLWGALEHKIIYGENINLTFNYFVSGNVDAAFIARSQLVEYQGSVQGKGVGMHYYVLHDPQSRIHQYGVIMKSSQAAKQANDFVNYMLHSKEAQKIIQDMGYENILLNTIS